jgi:multidrug efflux system outer membrane protein
MMMPFLSRRNPPDAKNRKPNLTEIAVVAGLLAAISIPASLPAADAPMEYASDSPWPKATRASDAPAVSVPAHFKGENRDTVRIISSASRGNASRIWWTIFRDSKLNELENEALAANQDLRQALARITEARMQARAAAADFFPHLLAPLNLTRQRTTDTGPVLPARIVGSGAAALFGGALGSTTIFSSQAASTIYNDFQAPLQLSYELDFFGRIRHTYGQARASAQATEAEHRAIELSLSAEVATDYFALRALDSQVEVLQHTVDLRLQAAHMQQKRLDAGLASKLDYSRAEVDLDNTDADLNDAIRQRSELENAMAALCGHAASDFRIPPNSLGNVPPPAAPAGVPSALLTQRPDMIEAERRLAAASEGIGAARAELFPTVNLQGNYGYESAQFGQLFEDRSREWSVTAGVSIPIFEGGRNEANLRAARARRAEAFAAYQQTAVTAFKEAENAMIDLRQRISQSDARERAVSDSKLVLDGSEKRYLEGAVNYFEVIDAERLFLNAQLSRVQTMNARYAATVDLVRAFGGGYAVPEPTPPVAHPAKRRARKENPAKLHKSPIGAGPLANDHP